VTVTLDGFHAIGAPKAIAAEPLEESSAAGPSF
jgi:hypothetical protein